MAKKRKYGFNDDQEGKTSVSRTTKCLTGGKTMPGFFVNMEIAFSYN